jgi:hypothetical protein
VFLTSCGDVILEGPFSSAPARQAARLLHDLVSPDQTPPAARLLIGRWTNSDAQTLSEFNAELAYFARPNGPDLVAAVYERGAASPSATLVTPPPVRQAFVDLQEPRKSDVEPASPREHAIGAWLKAHRRQVVGATAVAAAFVAAGVMVSLWPSSAAAGRTESAALSSSGENVEQPGANGKTDRSAPAAATTGRSNRSAAVATAPAARPSPAKAAIEASALPVTTDLPVLEVPIPQASPAVAPAQPLRPTRVYTAADTDVEPPILRSSEIPEWLITGFEVRKNSVEVLISADGGVQRARMLGAPQRLPDVMLLSRVKEWVFAPATRDGIPVPYRLVLSWNVTP